MLRDIFLQIVNMSISAGWLILVIILLRQGLKRISQRMTCVLWVFVGIRLLCPILLQADFSLIPSAETVNTAEFVTRPYIQSGISAVDHAANGYLGEHYAESVSTPAKDLPTPPINILAIVWLLGVIAMLCYLLISYLRLKHKLQIAVPIQKKVYLCDGIQTPFIMGMVKPRIYIPSTTDPDNYKNILLHEQTHLKKKDHWWKMLAFLILSVYWFHPLLWVSYVLLCQDLEMACDESVIRNLDAQEKKQYAQSLLDCSAGKSRFQVCPLAFGQGKVKERIKVIMNYKKPTFLVLLVSICCLFVVAVCFLTNPSVEKEKDSPTSTVQEIETETITVSVPVIDLSKSSGADGAMIYYADENRMIFGGYFGLFVYDTKKNEILRSVDLKSIGCNATQGDDFCEVLVEADGSVVYLHPISMNDMYVYHVEENTMTKTKYNLEEKNLYTGDTYATEAEYVKQGKKQKYFLVNAFNTIGDLGFRSSESKEVYPLFAEDKLKDATFLSRREVKDIVQAEITLDGVHYVCTDKEILKNLEQALQNGTEIKGGSGCPFHDVMYLTRADGSVGKILPATDDCNIYLLQDGYFEVDKGLQLNINHMISKGIFLKD